MFLPIGKKGTLKGREFQAKKDQLDQAKVFLKARADVYLLGEDPGVRTNLSTVGMSQEEEQAELQLREAEALIRAERLQRNKENLLGILEWACVPGYSEFLEMFVDRTLPRDVLEPAAKLIQMLLTHSCAATCVLPFRYLPHLELCLEALQEGGLTESLMCEMELYSPEILHMLQGAEIHNQVGVVVRFLQALIDFIRKVHSSDKVVGDTEPIPNTYNPAEGTAYYFTEHGNKLRQHGIYDLHKESTDPIDQGCKKIFPQVSYGGFGYMFLYMCPEHGHGYGFHMVKGGEGRKDAFAPLFKYKPSPPKEVYYDFACQASEYCLNREPEWFKWVRFWHDLFHAVYHVCVPLFKSRRVQGLESANSEICEQFNSYLKSIKFTASSMTQKHFMLFTQFMILRWNRLKTKLWREIEQTSFGGIL
jgi:hypothetical protein